MDAFVPAAARAAPDFPSAAGGMLNFLAGFSAAMLVAAAIGVPLAWRARRKLQAVAAQSRALLAGSYAALDAPADRDLAVVVEALNGMLGRWRDAPSSRTTPAT